jgi:hypothetical protein
MKSSFVIVLFSAACALAQPPRGFDALPETRQFLQLTDSQVQAIVSNNDAYNRWSGEKQSRIRQVQIELAEETARQALDPAALGMRYAEIETICREMKERVGEYRARNLNVLTADQKTRLKVLEDAIKLAAAISEAQWSNLIGESNSAPPAFISAAVRIGGSVFGGIIGGAPGCGTPFLLVLVIRSGDFGVTAARASDRAN